MRVLLASGNRKKAAEIAAILDDVTGARFEVLTLADFPALAAPEETGASFLENARIKALSGAAGSGLPTLGEDSGLAVDALGGAPGILSARYAAGDDWARCGKLLRELGSIPPGQRAARYVCAAVFALPDGREATAQGTCEGAIALAPRGTGGFGYDPVFLLPDGRTMAELAPEQKAAISHRGRALRLLAPNMMKLLAGSVP
ncbi:MAG: RdgB/HAM1 family non-canonical purine NTP pyrophosphatase [Candidatus Geothermincolia bacterium]